MKELWSAEDRGVYRGEGAVEVQKMGVFTGGKEDGGVYEGKNDDREKNREPGRQQELGTRRGWGL